MKLVAAACFLLMIGAPAYGGQTNAQQVADARTLPAPVELYTLNCWGCHKPEGQGIPGSVPRLSGTVGYFLHVPGGRAYLIEVPGVAGSALTDAQVAEVLNWVLETFSRAQIPPGFKPYTEAEVAKYRAHELNDIKHVRGKLARELALKGIKIPPED